MRVRRAFLPSNSLIGDQRESLQRLEMSPARIDFDEVGASAEEPLDEVNGSGSSGGDKEVEINLNDKLGSLLNSLNQCERK